MRLKDILQIYHKELDGIYGKNEVDSFFNLLLDHYLNLNRIHLVLEPEYVVTKSEEQPLFEALSQLKLQVPIQYVIGETEFYGMQFKVNKHTLIPRPETEELVSWIVTEHSATGMPSTRKVLDIGTGSGCIAIALAKHLPNATISAIDVSKEALFMAHKNAKLNAVDVDFSMFNILQQLDDQSKLTDTEFDIIVSNPPYVRLSEKQAMKPNVLDNEPHVALFVEDEHPLQFYRAICEFAKTNLKDTGHLYFEINEYLGNEMMELMVLFGFKNIQLRQDIFGKDRMMVGQK